tara:strand:- start:1108 stop:1518 length:411 start_codon:yes stop_codon:yes gene_type:complete
MNFGTAYFESEFIRKCGVKSIGYPSITPMGKQKSIFYQVFTVIVFIGMIICLTIGYGKSEDKKKEFNKSTKTIFKVLFWLLFIGFIPLTGIAVYRYVIYLSEYSKWFSSLPYECQMKLQAIHGIEAAMDAINNSKK